MTYQNDPNRRDHRNLNETNYTPWIIGSIVALALILGVFFMTSDRTGTSTATNTSPVTTTTPPLTGPTTTGQRSDPVQPANPAGNTPTAPGSTR